MKRFLIIFVVAILFVFQSKAQDLYHDSLALVALYDSTNGPSWVNDSNWLSGPLSTWYGVTVDTAIGRVTGLDLSSNGLRGKIPSIIGSLTGLKILNLSGEDSLYGSIPSEITNLTQLQELYLNNNYLAGAIPDSIGKLVNLKYLFLNNNLLSGSIPESIGNLENVVTLFLANNKLIGEIPTSIGNMLSVKYLYLYNNRLTGRIPQQVCNLTNLVQLYLEENELYGHVPDSIGKLSNLQILYLYDNKLSGKLPKSLTYLTSLTTMNISNNMFEDSFPDISNLVNLTSLDISNNEFSYLPDLSGLSGLTSFKVYNNNLTFADLEPNIKLLTQYSPQGKVGSAQYIKAEDGDTLKLVVTVPGEHNIYQWFKNDTAIVGATSSVYYINGYEAKSDSGIYYCKITDTLVPNLSLRTYDYFVGVTPKSYSITVEVDPVGAATISGGGNYFKEQKISVRALPNYGYMFKYWKENGQIVYGDSIYSFVVDTDRVLTAVLAPKSFQIDVSVYPAGWGSASGGGTYLYGDTVTVSATAEAGYKFCCWTVGGDTVSTENPYTFVVDSSEELVANFVQATYVRKIWHDSVLVVPNPTRNGFMFKGLNRAARVEILNLQGKVIYKAVYNPGEKINVRALAAGVYLVRLRFGDKVLNFKLIKQ